jgi:hypothetical protein
VKRLRVLTAAATALAAAALAPLTASPAAAGTCGSVTYNEVDSTRIVITIGPLCSDETIDGFWIYVPISQGWSAIGGWQSGPGSDYATVTYTCAGTNPNTFWLIVSTNGTPDFGGTISDDCGPYEP